MVVLDKFENSEFNMEQGFKVIIFLDFKNDRADLEIILRNDYLRMILSYY
jgi:hypothetical protein